MLRGRLTPLQERNSRVLQTPVYKELRRAQRGYRSARTGGAFAPNAGEMPPLPKLHFSQ
jgi:hypothetical protein